MVPIYVICHWLTGFEIALFLFDEIVLSLFMANGHIQLKHLWIE